MQEIQQIKQRFGIIGNDSVLNRALDVAKQVAPTDLSVLITGESGVGKEVFPQIIHHFSSRKHGPYIAVNCGAIPEGTIDSELFGHEKGAFTGATSSREGYFEVADGGTIFLDEVGELPLSTQVRLLRVLETGEFIRVGSSKVHKINVRVIAATNVDVSQAVQKGKFREDLFYRLNTVPIAIPNLRERGEDTLLLFTKFAQDFADKYRMPAISLDEPAQRMLKNYRWPGNIRQLKNITEQISIIEQKREIELEILRKYLPDYFESKLPAVVNSGSDDHSFASEREILYKILFDLKKEFGDVKKLVNDLIESGVVGSEFKRDHEQIIQNLEQDHTITPTAEIKQISPTNYGESVHAHIEDTEEIVEESLSLADKEMELIKKALDKYHGKRKYAAADLGISERTLYRKIKEYNIQ